MASAYMIKAKGMASGAYLESGGLWVRRAFAGRFPTRRMAHKVAKRTTRVPYEVIEVKR